MKRTLKFLHEIGTVGVMGAVSVMLILSSFGKGLPIEDHAILREVIRLTSRLLLIPSLLIVLASGLIAMAVHKPYHNAGWVWAKLVTTPLVLEATLIAIDGPAQIAAKLSAKAAAGDAAAMTALEKVLRHEQGGLWVALFLYTANVALGVYRPKKRRRAAMAEPVAAAEEA
ncbi:MAG: hypothetical protein HC923_04845 [Myxococcales bacterium]|nr:hypothetical protein [Myxococcales bacterium]